MGTILNKFRSTSTGEDSQDRLWARSVIHREAIIVEVSISGLMAQQGLWYYGRLVTIPLHDEPSSSIERACLVFLEQTFTSLGLWSLLPWD